MNGMLDFSPGKSLLSSFHHRQPSRREMRPTIIFALAASLAATAHGQEIGQLNWRVTDLERRLAIAEQNVGTLAGQLSTLTTRFGQLEARFGQLVALLDQQMREQQ